MILVMKTAMVMHGLFVLAAALAAGSSPGCSFPIASTSAVCSSMGTPMAPFRNGDIGVLPSRGILIIERCRGRVLVADL